MIEVNLGRNSDYVLLYKGHSEFKSLEAGIMDYNYSKEEDIENGLKYYILEKDDKPRIAEADQVGEIKIISVFSWFVTIINEQTGEKRRYDARAIILFKMFGKYYLQMIGEEK